MAVCTDGGAVQTDTEDTETATEEVAAEGTRAGGPSAHAAATPEPARRRTGEETRVGGESCLLVQMAGFFIGSLKGTIIIPTFPQFFFLNQHIIYSKNPPAPVISRNSRIAASSRGFCSSRSFHRKHRRSDEMKSPVWSA